MATTDRSLNFSLANLATPTDKFVNTLGSITKNLFDREAKQQARQDRLDEIQREEDAKQLELDKALATNNAISAITNPTGINKLNATASQNTADTLLDMYNKATANGSVSPAEQASMDKVYQNMLRADILSNPLVNQQSVASTQNALINQDIARQGLKLRQAEFKYKKEQDNALKASQNALVRSVLNQPTSVTTTTPNPDYINASNEVTTANDQLFNALDAQNEAIMNNTFVDPKLQPDVSSFDKGLQELSNQLEKAKTPEEIAKLNESVRRIQVGRDNYIQNFDNAKYAAPVTPSTTALDTAQAKLNALEPTITKTTKLTNDQWVNNVNNAIASNPNISGVDKLNYILNQPKFLESRLGPKQTESQVANTESLAALQAVHGNNKKYPALKYFSNAQAAKEYVDLVDKSGNNNKSAQFVNDFLKSTKELKDQGDIEALYTFAKNNENTLSKMNKSQLDAFVKQAVLKYQNESSNFDFTDWLGGSAFGDITSSMYFTK